MNRFVSILFQSVFLTCALSVTLFAAPLYSVTDLGTLGGQANGINNAGQVTGYVGGPGPILAFFYDGALHPLGTLGGEESIGQAINDNGRIAGASYITPIRDSDGRIEREYLRAFIAYGGAMNDAGTLGGDNSYAYGINAGGQITGFSDTRLPNGQNGANQYRHAFLGNGIGMIDIGTLGGTYSQGNSINDSAQITGDSYTSAGFDHAFLYSGGSMTDLGTLGGGWSQGYAINSSGQITGIAAINSSGQSHAFFFDGTMHDLGTLNGDLQSSGWGINSSGQIVGNSDSGAFIYDSVHGMQDLNTLIDPLSGWRLEGGTAINDQGQIVGSGLLGGQEHSFLLTPISVPEPTSILLAASGFGGLAAAVCRRRPMRRKRRCG